MTNQLVSILGGVLIFLVILFFIVCLMSIALAINTLNDFINYMENAFLNMFTLIEQGVVELFDILYQDVVDLIDELF